MEQEVFDDCLQHWKNSNGNLAFWDELAKKWNYKTAEYLRITFKNARKRLGITKENVFTTPFISDVSKKLNNTKAKILLWDAETSPILCLAWDIWQQNINTDAILQDWHFISWSAKWLYSDKIISDVLSSEEAIKHDDRRIVESISKLLDEADIVITHNGDSFDNPRLNTRLIYHGLKPISNYQSIDTLKIAKSAFDFTSRKLDYINQYLGLPQKADHDFALWKKSYFGDSESLKKLKNYNVQDIRCLEDLFLRLRPFAKGLPNMNLYSEENITVCPCCGSSNIQLNGKFYYTNTGKYKQFSCLECGSYGRSRFTEIDKDKSKTIIR